MKSEDAAVQPPSTTSPSLTIAQTSPKEIKEIKFIANDGGHGGPYNKRRRIAAACSTCKKRKIRCSGERPLCTTCAQRGQKCGGYANEPSHDRRCSADDGHNQEHKGARQGERGEKTRQTSSATTQHSDNRNYALHRSMQRGMSTWSATSNGLGSVHHETNELYRAEPHESPIAAGSQPFQSLATRNRMPYFRYFGPTAIMPGFKQMVVKVDEKRHTSQVTTSEAHGSPSQQISGAGDSSASQAVEEHPALPDIPVYDNSSIAPSPLITHLCQTFFTYLGCNFPFLQRERFMRDLEAKEVDAILVDAVCALAARFSNDPYLTGKDDSLHNFTRPVNRGVPPAERGIAFEQRAKHAITDTFACPSVAVVQAALLLAYNEFGGQRDSGLWMYLGIAIRMAQDLGMHKLDGLRYEGKSGPSPRSTEFKLPTSDGSDRRGEMPSPAKSDERETSTAVAEQRAVERERIDTLWAVYFLDRVISSGTGRPVTLRDKEIEVAFPHADATDPATGLPLPFPALIRIIHLYGRVTDVLNGITKASQVTPDVNKRLASFETRLTDIYQALSPRLHFNAVNFQRYVKIDQGTTFILLHFWFHTLIVLLHQPTLLHTVEGEIRQLLPNSRELSMSSAKTMADILVFVELIDAKSGFGNPFTSQPTYIAACAFLKESAIHTASSKPTTRCPTPVSGQDISESRQLPESKASSVVHTNGTKPDLDHVNAKLVAKHSLLATAAKQNYQRCYRALQQLETYWAGTKYILTVLDQKAEGVRDALLYTREEEESALEEPKIKPAFTCPGWRRKLSWGSYLTSRQSVRSAGALVRPRLVTDQQAPADSSAIGPGQGEFPAPPTKVDGVLMRTAIGWSLTGTMNSPSTSLALLYPSTHRGGGPGEANDLTHASAPVASGLPTMPPPSAFGSQYPFSESSYPPYPSPYANQQQAAPDSRTSQTLIPPLAHPEPNRSATTVPADPSLLSDADLLLNLHSPYPPTSPHPVANGGTPNLPSYSNSPMASFNHLPANSMTTNGLPGPGNMTAHQQQQQSQAFDNTAVPPGEMMMIESQDIDMSALVGEDMMPWLEYLPYDMFGMYDQQQGSGGGEGQMEDGEQGPEA
ncbi:hypothetical protein LTS18_006199 [Coniosporium uncinatum]|uniref:Uncharacterized protein n=1 Tax=Coniosporium uncinatum TaxID=93489 RepID=A0ACC3DDI2_9PEZI|nr:hypothetical protein LTS18_006199 [Coniosporium uncinatum]